MLVVACVLYPQLQGRWLWFAPLFVAPDASMLGYLVNKRIGAMSYNLLHTYTAPLALLGVLRLTGHGAYAWLVAVWLAHIGLDRMIGVGLKYETAFRDTHLQRT